MPAKKELKINLLPQKEFEKSLLGRILKWALSSFRIIVIVTEMIVMAAFLSRFWLDARNSDLNDQITQKKVTILSFNETEKRFRLLQQRLNIFSQLSAAKPTSGYIQTIVSYMPQGISLNSVSKSANSIQITGSSGNEQDIAQFIANLQSAKTFSSVSLSQIASNKQNQSMMDFTIKASLEGS